ncbi:nucleotidyltransferase domain-containing protein [Denitratimonas tolerans]|uniref:Nucleotidyltransferase domain-containing protein n=1 Tax=Denitratimonas tolerans TaxID=1338420 RepID=A0AAW9RCV7_9GAMM
MSRRLDSLLPYTASGYRSKMIPTDIRSDILDRLHKAEAEHGVRVLLAVESGSRAWGFSSPNSDYDARFIYVHPRDWYVSVGLEEQRDVIEYPIVDDIDINGWDLRKALRLFWKSNPAFVEWIQSPIVYRQDGPFADLAREALPAIYSCEKGIYHYRSMAKNNFRGYLRADQVPLKKYFYVLRPLLAVRWQERHQQAAPIEFEKLLALAPDNPALRADIQALLVKKRAAPEMGLESPIASIHDFIESELERLEAIKIPKDAAPDKVSRLNDIFRRCLAQAWT